MTNTPTIFISYSHQDENPWMDFVVGHLKVAERQGVFDIWQDRRIKGGGDWRTKIDQALSKADIAVLLISRHFLISDFIMDHEVQMMLQRHATDDVILYPILISDCTWQTVDWLRAINIRPKDGTPLNSFNDAERDQVMTNIASEIGRILHPNRKAEDKNQASATPVQHRRRDTGEKTGFFHWWRTASITARATVLGTVFAGLALIWTIVAGGGDQITANCSPVNTGTIEGAEINVDC